MQTAVPSDVPPSCSDRAPRCHACGGSETRPKFSVPLLRGQHPSDRSIKKKIIYRCNSCGHLSASLCDPLMFASYYESLSADCHGAIHDADQFRYQQVFQILAGQTVCRVLDIGCGTGTFLAKFPPGVERFGIEPTRAAADIARARGITILDPGDLERPEMQHSFDVVTALDVIEHATDLDEFRQQIASALRPGGKVILLTGDAESGPARFLGSYWYYMHGAEHITFFCARSIRRWLQRDFEGIELTRTSHNSLRKEWAFLIRAWLVFPAKWVLMKLIPDRLNKEVCLYLPGDHMLVRANLARRLKQDTVADA